MGRLGGVGHNICDSPSFRTVATSAAVAATERSHTSVCAVIILRCRRTTSATAGIMHADAITTQANPYLSIMGYRIWAKYAYSPRIRYGQRRAGQSSRAATRTPAGR